MDSLHYFEPTPAPALASPSLCVTHARRKYVPHLVRIRKRRFTAEMISRLDLERHGHAHRIYHLIYILEGANTIRVADRTIPVRTSQMVAINPDVYHNVIPRQPRDFAFLTLMFTYRSGRMLLPVPFDQLLEHRTGMRVQVETVIDDNKGVLRAYFSCLEKEVLEHQHKDLRRVSYCLDGLLNELLGIGVRRDQRNPVPENILAAREYLLDHLDQPVTIRDLTEVSDLSRSQLIGKFKQHYGTSPIDLLIRERIDKAKTYLRHSTKRIKEIACLCGFQSEYYFSKTFKKRTHLTPGQFRRSNTEFSDGND